MTPQPPITMEHIFVTPELALKWLELPGANNRNISRSRVEIIARDIADDQFYATHQGVAFDDKGALCDGQHRLSAIVEAGIGLWLFVARGIDSRAMAVIDSGRSRTLADRATISDGWEHATSAIAIARIIAELEIHSKGAGRASDLAIMKTARREKENIDWVISKKSKQYVKYAPVAAALAYSRPILAERADLFADRLATGEMLTPGSPILALRNYLDHGTTRGGGAARIVDLRIAFILIRAYVMGEECKHVRDSTVGLEWIRSVRHDMGLVTY